MKRPRMVYEIYMQLLGRAGGRQLEKLAPCLTQNLDAIPSRNVVRMSVLGLHAL